MILTFDSVWWFNNIMRAFFGGIDYLVYSLISWIVEGIFNLANLNANPALTEIIYKRVYVILGIFMIFKLSFSFLKYIVNPDSMNDKEQGVGKLITRVVVMLALLVALPILFFSTDLIPGRDEPILNVLQNGVIKTLPKVVLGITDDKNATGKTTLQASADSYGDYMALMMLRSFYYPSKCNPDSTQYDSTITCDMTSSNNINDLNGFMGTMFDSDDGAEYDYQYMWPLTTLAGVLLVVVLLGIAIDIAIRCFKLLILQMLAPVPVMMYIDPKASKDGAFSSWLKNFISTYIDIFIKLGTVYLLLLLVSKLFDTHGNGLFGTGIGDVEGFMSRNFVRVFLIIGLFKFAKDAPKFIKDILGIKDNGGGGGMFGKALSGMAGAAAGFAGGVATGGLAGGLSGIVSGFGAGTAGNAGKAFSQVRDEQAKLLGKTPGGAKGKIQNAAMRSSVMKHTGLNKDSLKAAKEDMIKKQNKAAELASIFQRTGNATYTDDEGNVYSGYKAVEKAQAASAKAQSNYESANSIAGQIGLKPNFFQENKRHGKLYRAANRIATKDTILGHTNPINTAVEKITHRDVDNIANLPEDLKGRNYEDYERVKEFKKDYKTAKAEYDSALAGGFGPVQNGDRKADLAQAKMHKDIEKEHYKRAKREEKR